MTSVFRLAASLFSVCVCLAATAHGFFVTQSPIYQVAPSDRVSSSQLFARDCVITIDSRDWNPKRDVFPSINMLVMTPGLTYITYVENATARSTPVGPEASQANTTVYGSVKISGSSEAVVGAMDCNVKVDSSVNVMEKPTVMKALPGTETLLVEIRLYERQSLKSLMRSGTGDMVILENVLYKSRNTSETKREGMIAIEAGDGRLFVHDPTAVVSVDALGFSTAQKGAIQVELAALNTSDDVALTYHTFGNTVTMLVNQMSPVTAKAGYGVFNSSSLCIAAQNDVNVTSKSYSSYPTQTVSSSMYAKGATCSKLPLPERKPMPIDSKLAAAQAATTAPAAKSAAETRYGPGCIMVALMSGLSAWLSTATN